MNSDADLLRQFSETRDEACFAEIVQRHIRFVHAISVRRLYDAQAAQDATQAAFIALARKAGTVMRTSSLRGWLHRSACYETRNLMRAQANRLARETEAHRLGTTQPQTRPHLEAIESVLDDVLCELPASDREAIVARYLSEQSYTEIGSSAHVSENAARMRVERALAKLRDRLERRGVTSTATALAAVLPSYASAKVPSEFAASVAKASVAGLTGAAGTAVLVGFMSTTKVMSGIAVVAALGGLAFVYHANSKLESELKDARAESSASSRQFQDLQRQIAELKKDQRVTSPTTPVAATLAVVPPVTTSGPAPIPGVTPKAPVGWFKNGSANNLYEVGVDQNNSWGGMPSAYAKSIGAADGKFGGMMQTISADAYLNQRVRLSGWAKTEDANEGGGHLWLRVDGQESGKMLQFDNMDGRAPKGTTDWQEYSVVLDVPPGSARLNYGFFVQGKGQMWVNGLTITPVGNDVASTNMLKKAPALPATPVNLGFASPNQGP